MIKCKKCGIEKTDGDFFEPESGKPQKCKECVGLAIADKDMGPGKYCSKCGRFDVFVRFSRHQSWCNDCHGKYVKTWRQKNYDKFYLGVAKQNLKTRKEVLEHYSGGAPFCVCCGVTEYQFLTIEHKDGGGSIHRKTLKRHGVHFLRWLKNQGYPEGYEVLCFNCNYALGSFGQCPHGKIAAYQPRNKRLGLILQETANSPS